MMYKNGYLKAELASPKIKVGDVQYNKENILNILNNSKASLLLFPELSLTGYTANDLFFFEDILSKTSDCLKEIIKSTKFKGLYVIGGPLDVNGVLFNCAFVCKDKKLLGVVPKKYIPTTHEFYEKRHFSAWDQEKKNVTIIFDGYQVPFGNLLFEEPEKKILIGIDICQDMWAIYTPSDDMAVAGANIILNLSASPETVLKHNIRKTAVIDHSRKQLSAYLYTSSNFFESSSDVVFSGHRLASAIGKLLVDEKPFSSNDSVLVDLDIDAINYQRRSDSTYRDSFLSNRYQYQNVLFALDESKDYKFTQKIKKYPFIKEEKSFYSEIDNILVHALAKKILSLKENLRKIIIGISGGLDSTLALIIATKAFELLGIDKKNIIAVTMPAEVTKKDSINRALNLMNALKVTVLEIPINKQVEEHLKSINHHDIDVTYENVQARIRTLNLMDLAGKYQGIVLGTGDLSEIALGFMTYNGDQMSMYSINSGLPKTIIKELVKYYANNELKEHKELLSSILVAKISPELLENQETEKIIGSYEINDFIMYHHLIRGANENKIAWLIEKTFKLDEKESMIFTNRFFKYFYNSQFKRATLPEGPKVLGISLSPRGDFRLPSDVERK
ncbi:NAD(+) synthase [Acholeplasma sp. OttesenSCG-928-E16]|nr:NAD(+) synthase [Acholeplasma sp. OttesenSCG-928-E16]